MSRYFKGGGFFERLLRFLNLLEPGHMVLSLSKISMWGTGAVTLYVLFFHVESLVDMLGALSAFGTASGNYAYRRHKQYASGSTPYPNAPRTIDTVPDEAQDKALNNL